MVSVNCFNSQGWDLKGRKRLEAISHAPVLLKTAFIAKGRALHALVPILLRVKIASF